MRKWAACGIVLILLTMTLLGGSGRLAVSAGGAAEITEETAYVALTFDDGPRRGTTDRLLDGLKERGASATFFLVGEQAQYAPELVQRMEAEGHQVGNHTWSHICLEETDRETALGQIRQTEQVLERILGGENYWVRPPYGISSPETRQQISVPLITWSVDPRDWESRNTDAVVQSVMEHVQPNSIVLLHDIYPTSVEAALQIVDCLQQEGYWFVTVEELLALNGIEPQPGTSYRSGDAGSA